MTGWAPDHLPGNILLWPKVEGRRARMEGVGGGEEGKERGGGGERGAESTGSWTGSAGLTDGKHDSAGPPGAHKLPSVPSVSLPSCLPSIWPMHVSAPHRF